MRWFAIFKQWSDRFVSVSRNTLRRRQWWLSPLYICILIKIFILRSYSLDIFFLRQGNKRLDMQDNRYGIWYKYIWWNIFIWEYDLESFFQWEVALTSIKKNEWVCKANDVWKVRQTDTYNNGVLVENLIYRLMARYGGGGGHLGRAQYHVSCNMWSYTALYMHCIIIHWLSAQRFEASKVMYIEKWIVGLVFRIQI